MSVYSAQTIRRVSFLCALLTMAAPWLHGQAGSKGALPVIEGIVCDSQDRPIEGVAVTLESAEPHLILAATTDSQGHYRFEAIPTGTYTLSAKREGYQEKREGPFVLHEQEGKSVALLLTKIQETGSSKNTSSAIEFSEEPQFTVAGVTDTTAVGGHGSGPVVRSSNALSKEAVALARGGASERRAGSSDSGHGEQLSEAEIRALLAQEDNADLHERLADIEESEARPLEAVREYQRAAEMQPTEPHLFAWGAELLLHHAPEPAIDVFSKGRRLYPQSSRMLIGLGAARYAQRSKEQAEQLFLAACDLNPSDPTPYLFLGRLQAAEKIEPSGWTERMKRFVSLHPENAMAHYLYAVALTKQERKQENFDAAEPELKTALELDAHLGDAYLQLGILRFERGDFAGAIAALQEAIENTFLPDEAHYHLAQVYRRVGETEKAGKEIEQYKKISEQKSEAAERERHEIPQFVYTLRGENPSPQTPGTDPR